MAYVIDTKRNLLQNFEMEISEFSIVFIFTFIGSFVQWYLRTYKIPLSKEALEELDDQYLLQSLKYRPQYGLWGMILSTIGFFLVNFVI